MTPDCPLAIPPGWWLLRVGAFIRAGDMKLNVFETHWLPTELTTKERLKVGQIGRVCGRACPYIRKRK